MENLDQNEKGAQNPASEEKGLSQFLAALPEGEVEKKPFFVRVKEGSKQLFVNLCAYFRSPDFFIWLRNWLKTNLFYLFPASLSAPLLYYCLVPPSPSRLQHLEWGTLDTLWRANLISLILVLFIAWLRNWLQGTKVEVKKNPHPFLRLFWYWVGANFIYILPILVYGSLMAAWYFLDGMDRFYWVAYLVITLWAISTFFSILIMSVTFLTGWVFRSLGHSRQEEDEMPLIDDVNILDKKADDDKAHDA